MGFMMQIGIDARLLAYRKGGISEYTRQLIDALAGLDTSSHFTIFHRYADRQSYCPAQNFKRANLLTPAHHRFERAALSVELMRFRLDLLHSPDFIPPFYGARKHVITVHDLHFLRYPDFQTQASMRYYAHQIQAAVERADHIFVQTDGTRQEIIEQLNVSPEKITVHWLGVHPNFHPRSTAALAPQQERYQLPAQYILFVGTIEPRKNIPGLIAAYRALQDQLPDLPPLVLVGQEGWNADESLAAMRSTAHVQWLQGVPFADLPAIYSGASVLVLPSFHEGFGMPALEAMAAGTPVVVARRGSLPEVVGDAGVYIEPEDIDAIAQGIAAVLTDTDYAEQLRTAGLARAQLFTWERTAQIALDVYRKVLSLS